MTTEPRRAWRPRHAVLLGLLVVLGGAIALVGWTRVSMSTEFCASCHTMQESVLSAAETLHADVPCLACHQEPGALGAVKYLPSLLLEGVDEVLGTGLARGRLEATPCESCHTSFRPTVLFEDEQHPGTDSTCADCHGRTVHRAAEEPPEDDHPPRYDQTHGRDVVAAPDLATCADCHTSDFCVACHVRGEFPHPEGWIAEHGPAQQAQGEESCSRCHEPVTFCAGCHGTEIPHQEGWTRVHARVTRDVGEVACATCHAPVDCQTCHLQHEVHVEQRLYEVPR